MPRHPLPSRVVVILLLLCSAVVARNQTVVLYPRVTLTVADENGLPVSGAQVTVSEPGRPALKLQTDYAGRCVYSPHQDVPYQVLVEKPGFYQATDRISDVHLESIEVVLRYEQVLRQEIDVVASPTGIDPEQTSDKSVMNTPEIVNIPYPTSRDIRNLLSFNPGVVQDPTGQVHLAGSQTYATLDLLDGLNIRSPVSGQLALRVSTDAVRNIDIETTRYPAEFGQATGGVVALNTGMGDNKFRFNATDFIPSFRQINGFRFDKFVPRVTFSGPLVRDRAWFFDGIEAEYDNIYISELPPGADSNQLLRGSNFFKAQVNLTPANILSGGLLFNGYHSPYDGISSLVSQQSTTKRDTFAWLPYLRDQHIFRNGVMLETGFALLHIRDGYEPHGNTPYQLTPEIADGSFFENLVSHSQREEIAATLYLPPRQWLGRHDLKAGIELDHITFDQTAFRAPVNYLREDGTLLRQSTFPSLPPATLHNFETGAYLQDRWLTAPGLLFEPGLRFDWDEIIRRPLLSPRLAVVYSPPGAEATTKISAGIGLYYEHTQLEYLNRTLAGIRYDTYYAADGVTPITQPLESIFQANDATLKQMHAINWSVAVERKLPGKIYANASFIEKRIQNGFVYANQTDPAVLSGTYLLTNNRRDQYDAFQIGARRTFAEGYTLFASYTRSSATTNSAIDYIPTVSLLGPQQSAPLPWDAPNRLLSWGWLPVPLPSLKKNWDFVYSLNWQSGLPFTSIDANHQVVGAAGSSRFPDFISFSPGLEWRFHLRGAYFGLRGVMQNATDNANPALVNNNVDSPAYKTFSQFPGRAFTARIRLIGAK